MTTSPTQAAVVRARNRLGGMIRLSVNPADIEAARADLLEAQLAREITEALAGPVKLDNDRRARLASMLLGGGQS